MNKQQTTTLLPVPLTMHQEKSQILSYHNAIVEDTSKYHLHHHYFEQLRDHVIKYQQRNVLLYYNKLV